MERHLYTVKDRGRRLDFEGELLGSGTSYTEHKPRWFEVDIYKTVGGKYVVAGAGRSRVVHSPTCERISNAKNKNVDINTDESEDTRKFVPCEVCKPSLTSTDLVKEHDREWAQVSEAPEAVIERLRLRDSDGVWYVPSTSTRALESAANLDEGIQHALYTPQHID